MNIFEKFDKYVSRSSFILTGLSSYLRMYAVNNCAMLGKKVLLITSNEVSAQKYQSDLKKIFNKDASIFPYQSISPYELLYPDFYDVSAQVSTLLLQPNIVIMPARAMTEKFPDISFYETNTLTMKCGDNISPKKLSQSLVDLGYKKVTMVSDVGEFSIRGDIADIYSFDENPLRLEFWGDEIVDIRFFNNETQRSIKKLDSANIYPLFKFKLSTANLTKLPNKIKEQILNEGFFEGVNVYQNFFNQDLDCIIKHFKDYILIFDEYSEIISKLNSLEEHFNNQLQENLKTELILPLECPNHNSCEHIINTIAGREKIYLNNFLDDTPLEVLDLNAESIPLFDANLEKFAEFIMQYNNYKLIIATDYSERVKEELAELGIFNFETIENTFATGCLIHELKLLFVTDRELFNKSNKSTNSSKKGPYKSKMDYIESLNDISEGDYVVHSVHGVGIYGGLTKQKIDGQLKDYLTIEYSNKDRLHIPAEQINLLSRYRGAGNIKPKLSRMGGADWENTKSRVKKEVETIAYDLLKLYARRKMKEGISFLPDTPMQNELEDSFEYIETPDQLKAIKDVKSDMENSTPMDRLICGDVGFGKTEVAMRAIFKAVASGKQVAVIVPTTLLAFQHFTTISERFKPFGVNVELLSRFRSKKEQTETLKNLTTGTCDVVIGTHRLLQKDIIFKDLGLLVIDEEHRFGVRHKEKIKEMRENIDILSMSATPIPRTLYMSLSGIKDISVINTPPTNRLPIKTFVGNYNEQSLKNAIIHELDRDGQVFYLYNRVETILDFKVTLQKIVPNARIAVAHGQMDEKQLEEIIVDFSNHEYDILLCTTIIENGIDIPNANTMIIHDADKLGLAQLYQIRGRVGRRERQAYCYCFYKANKDLTNEAKERLKAIKEFTTLSSGYRIAMRDIEIRGVGNILGTKQHGHMVNVGFDTYCQLLEDTVNELKGEIVENKIQAIIDINITAFIPDEWVGSKEQKMIEYKRLSDVKTEMELEYIISEWKDRFSKNLPVEVDNLTKLIRIRLLASSAQISAVRETEDYIRIYTPYTNFEWNLIRTNLKPEIARIVKFTQAPSNIQNSKSILLLKNMYSDFDELFNILTGLFYHIKEVSYKYRNEGY